MKKFIIRHKASLAQAALVILLVSLLALSGCFSSNQKNLVAFAKPASVDTTAENYVLQPPDEVEIHCAIVPELDKQRQQIRPDGYISFEKLGEVQAAGKTPKELAALIKEKIALLYSLPGDNPIDVRVVKFKSKMYYVLGMVLFPGPKEATGRDTVLTAVTQAQPTNLAWLSRIQVVRPSAEKAVKPKVFELNFEKLQENGDASKNVLLQEGDIVYVPPTIMAALGLKIGEFMQPIGQALTTVTYMKDVSK